MKTDMRNSRKKINRTWSFFEKMKVAEMKGNVEEYCDLVEAILPIAWATIDVMKTQVLRSIRKEVGEGGKKKFIDWWLKERKKIETKHEYVKDKRDFNVHEGCEDMSKHGQKADLYASWPDTIKRFLPLEIYVVHDKEGNPIAMAYDRRKDRIVAETKVATLVHCFYFDDKKDMRATNLIHQFLIDIDIMEAESGEFFI